MKYTIEVTKQGIVKTFDDGEKTYTETWINPSPGLFKTVGGSITDKMVDDGQYDDLDDEVLLDALESDNLTELMEIFAGK